MKNLIPLMAFALIILFGCSKEESILDTPNINEQEIEEQSDLNYVLNFDDDHPVWEAISPDRTHNNPIPKIGWSSGRIAYIQGAFARGSHSDPISFDGMQGEFGVRGSATFQQTLSLPFPPFNAVVRIAMTTHCVTVKGNEAIYGGLITESEGSPFPGGGPFAIGRYFYFKVKDNGNGKNAPVDQYYQTLYSMGTPDEQCGADLLNWSGLTDVQHESDQIRITTKPR